MVVNLCCLFIVCKLRHKADKVGGFGNNMHNFEIKFKAKMQWQKSYITCLGAAALLSNLLNQHFYLIKENAV